MDIKNLKIIILSCVMFGMQILQSSDPKSFMQDLSLSNPSDPALYLKNMLEEPFPFFVSIADVDAIEEYPVSSNDSVRQVATMVARQPSLQNNHVAEAVSLPKAHSRPRLAHNNEKKKREK